MGLLLDKAIIFAVNAHRGQLRKGTNTPYILHPMEAAAIVGSMTDDDEVIAAAVLHDTVEDTAVTLDEICEQFGKRVAELVAAESENKREDKPAASTWKIRKEETIAEIGKMNRDEKIIVLADKLSNVRAIYRDYAVLGDRLWEKFNCHDKNEQGWYYKSICDALREDFEKDFAWLELFELTARVFG